MTSELTVADSDASRGRCGTSLTMLDQSLGDLDSFAA
jgi:hypothetical protein